MSITDLLRRAIAWLRRNPEARAHALELTAVAARARADVREREGMARTADRLRRRAEVLDARAQQLRDGARR